jgi:hypothetical protein
MNDDFSEKYWLKHVVKRHPSVVNSSTSRIASPAVPQRKLTSLWTRSYTEVKNDEYAALLANVFVARSLLSSAASELIFSSIDTNTSINEGKFVMAKLKRLGL